MAYETFTEDTIVDVTPYTPANWHFASTGLSHPVASRDSSGYVLKITSTDTALVYRDRPGTEQPAICLLAPYTNLDWKNYELTGTIVKPAGDVYDSVEVGFVFYYENENSYYKVVAEGKPNNLIRIFRSGNAIPIDTAADGLVWEGSTNSVNFVIRVTTSDRVINPDSVISDGLIEIQAKAWNVGATEPDFPEAFSDITSARNIKGLPGLILNKKNTSLKGNTLALPIQFKNISIRKITP
jgi:hypothetical protein